MSDDRPQPLPAITALPAVRPFVAPEELARQAGHTELLRLGANESAFGPAPAVITAMRGAVARTAWYGDPESMDLREALARKHGCSVGEISVGAGIDEILGLVVRTFLAPGDVSVATAGTYATYAYHVTNAGARVATVPYARDGAAQLDELAARVHASGAKAVYLANPDNPSGHFAPRAAVAALRAALPERCLLVLDEAYADFVAPGDLLPEAVDPRIIRLRTFSKAYGLAGARVAYALASRETIATFDKIRVQYVLNRTGQIGALAALGEPEYVARVVAEVERGRAEYAALGARLGCASLTSRTNFVCLDLGSRSRAEAMVAELLRRAVFVRKPAAPPLDGYIRVTVGTPPERARFAEIFAAALAEIDRQLPLAVPSAAR